MARALTVVARGEAAAPQAAPEPTATIRLLEYAFGVSEPLTADRHLIKVENLGVDGVVGGGEVDHGRRDWGRVAPWFLIAGRACREESGNGNRRAESCEYHDPP
jgi:hypothetical protein